MHTTTTPSQTQTQEVRASEARRLTTAARLAHLKAKRRPLLAFRQGTGKSAVEVLFEWPGLLSVYDATTCRLLAQSAPGDPYALGGWASPGGWHGAPAAEPSNHEGGPV